MLEFMGFFLNKFKCWLDWKNKNIQLKLWVLICFYFEKPVQQRTTQDKKIIERNKEDFDTRLREHLSEKGKQRYAQNPNNLQKNRARSSVHHNFWLDWTDSVVEDMFLEHDRHH